MLLSKICMVLSNLNHKLCCYVEFTKNNIYTFSSVLHKYISLKRIRKNIYRRRKARMRTRGAHEFILPSRKVVATSRHPVLTQGDVTSTLFARKSSTKSWRLHVVPCELETGSRRSHLPARVRCLPTRSPDFLRVCVLTHCELGPV